jgi:hydrogenase/urease accessory protein HupE
VTRRLAVATGLATALAPAAAHAHIVASRLGDFYTGAAHALTGLEDIVLWLALGLLAGAQAPARARWVVVAFPVGLLAGVLVGFAPPPLFDAGAMVVLGGLLALARPLPVPAVAGIALALGVARGGANIAGLPPSGDATLFAAGLLASGYAVATLASAGTLAFRTGGAPWRDIAIRACGSWVAAIGVMFAAFAARSH